ncbi:MAG: aminoacyl--tRNA ligase-related protein, partial [Patescibacteria group bacterium]
MLDINLIRADPERVKKGIMTKNADPKLVDEFLWFDGKWRALMQEVENLRARQKKAGEERNIKEAKQLKEEIHAKEGALREVENTRDTVLRKLPNLPLPSVPVGASDKENMVLREVGEKPKFDFAPRDYLALAEALDLVDMERAAKVSGSRFAYLKNEAVLLEFAIARLVFDTLGKEGFVPLVPPVIVNEEMMRGMGYVDRGEDLDETYYLEKDKQYLVGTAEQSVGPMHAGEIFSEQELPKRYVAFSTSFRREAGSYGKDTKGILRVHQFDKLE